jgi:hypothetical protein
MFLLILNAVFFLSVGLVAFGVPYSGIVVCISALILGVYYLVNAIKAM